MPKIHEHDGKPPQGFGLIHNGRLICFYSYEADLGNGWEDQSIYNDPEELRQKALHHKALTRELGERLQVGYQKRE